MKSRIRTRTATAGFALSLISFVACATAGAADLLYFSTKANTEIPGVPGPYDDADIYRLDPATGAYDRIFDARDAGLPGNADIDALHVVEASTYYMSFTRGKGTNVPGLGSVESSDVVLYSAGTFQLFFDGSDVGLGDKTWPENIDAIEVESDSAILISTNGKPSIGVSGANKEDVLRCEGTLGAATDCTWSLHFDGSVNSLRGRDENVDAYFELGDDLYLSTRGPFTVPGVSGKNNDILRCVTMQVGSPKNCASFERFLEGDFYALPDKVDAIDYAAGGVVEPPPPPEEFRVVILGSSTARGKGASKWRNAWARQFDRWLRTVTSEHEVFNLSRGGQSTVDIRPDGSTPSPNEERNVTHALTLDPDLILINLPSNNVADGIPVATTIAHYQEIIAAADQQNVQVLLTTTQPRNFDDFGMRMLLMDEAIAVRAEFGADVIDIYDELTDFNTLGVKAIYDSGDGTHLNDAGHTYIFETVRDKVAPLVTQ